MGLRNRLVLHKARVHAYMASFVPRPLPRETQGTWITPICHVRKRGADRRNTTVLKGL